MGDAGSRSLRRTREAAEDGRDPDLGLAPVPGAARDQAAGIAPGAAPSPGTGPGQSHARGLAPLATTNGRTGTGEGASRDPGASPEAGQDQAAVTAIKRK